MKVCWKHPGVLLLPLLAMPLALIISVPANDGLSQNRRGHRPCPNGIEGQVLLGPTCPVITVPPDPKCEDKPYEARITVKSGSGQKGTDAAAKEVARFSSNSKGEFRLCLPPGRYLLEGTNATATFSRVTPQWVNVEPGRFAVITIHVDSGIR